MTGFPWGRCSEIAFNTDTGNISVADGVVRLTARRENYDGFCFNWDPDGTFNPYNRNFEYTTGMLYTVSAFKYGYFECRFRAPRGKSFNSAFWLYGPEATEVDIFEIVGSDTGDAQMTLHWKADDILVGTSQWPKHVNPQGPDFDKGFHIFVLEWTPEGVTWYLDNWRVPEPAWTRFIRGRHVPDVEMNVILTLGVGGMDGDPDSATPFPSDFEIDYVRVYQRATPAR
jgi:beta-glucanase (GH16 family)